VVHRLPIFLKSTFRGTWTTSRKESPGRPRAVRADGALKRFSRTYNAGKLDAATSAEIAGDVLKLEQESLDLLKKYHAIIAKDLSPLQAGQFLLNPKLNRPERRLATTPTPQGPPSLPSPTSTAAQLPRRSAASPESSTVLFEGVAGC